jgi:phthalate 4,5-dioxygenase oxygenase subunit
MGQMMRRYWLPALLTEEIAEPDGPPVAVRLFGENLVAFRDSGGRVGLLDAHCPHRRSSLTLARNEERGLTCIYHGWRFDVDGACLAMPTEPDEHGFRDRMRIRSYPVREAAGMIWTYMGPPEALPPFRDFCWTKQPRNEVGITKVGIRANFAQSVEGSIDSAHSWFLHRGSSRDWEKRFAISEDQSPRLEAEDTPYGFRYAAIRRPVERPEEQQYVRVTLFVLPSMSYIVPPLEPNLPAHTQVFVPIDNENTYLFDVFYSQNGTPVDEEKLRSGLNVTRGADLDERYFNVGDESTMWNQDREAMKRGSWTGIKGFQNQDVAAIESMGEVVDRTQEHLGTSDVAVIRMRRRMLEAVRQFQATGAMTANDPSIPFERLRSEQKIIPRSQPWQSVGAHADEYAAAR